MLELYNNNFIIEYNILNSRGQHVCSIFWPILNFVIYLILMTTDVVIFYVVNNIGYDIPHCICHSCNIGYFFLRKRFIHFYYLHNLVQTMKNSIFIIHLKNYAKTPNKNKVICFFFLPNLHSHSPLVSFALKFSFWNSS